MTNVDLTRSGTEEEWSKSEGADEEDCNTTQNYTQQEIDAQLQS